MKKIFLFILILISLKGFSQYPVNTAVGNASQLQYQNGAYGARLGYVFKDAYGDTTAANLSFIKNVPGQVIRVGNTLWMRNTALTTWIQIGSPDLSGYLLKADSSVNGGYYPYATNPKSYLVAADLSGYVPIARTLTINGTTYDLSANRSWTVASTNIYNTDGTLTGDRGVTLDGHSLNFINGTGNLILWGDGTTQLQSPSFFGGYNAFVQGNTYPAEFQVNPTSSSGVSTMISLVRNHSTTGSSGVGVSIDFKPPTSGGGSNLANRFISKWATVTHASRTSEVDITGVNNATDETYMNIQTGGIVRVNNNADTLATRAYARSFGGGGGNPYINSYVTADSLYFVLEHANGDLDSTDFAGGGGSIDEAGIVHKSGDETIGGVKTFTSPIVGTSSITSFSTSGGSGSFLTQMGGTSVGSDTYGAIQLGNSANAFLGTIYTDILTSNQFWTFPNASGMVALTTDITSSVGTETVQEYTSSTSSVKTLSNTPISGSVQADVNGIIYRSSNVSVVGTTVTLSGLTLETSDIVTIRYRY